jgi:hypothetical protein
VLCSGNKQAAIEAGGAAPDSIVTVLTSTLKALNDSANLESKRESISIPASVRRLPDEGR